MHGHIREKRNTQLCKPKHHNFAMPKHTDVIHDWRANGEMVIYAFLLEFSSHSVKKSDMSMRYKK